MEMIEIPEKLLHDEERVTPAGIVTTQTANKTDERLWGIGSARPKAESQELELVEVAL